SFRSLPFRVPSLLVSFCFPLVWFVFFLSAKLAHHKSGQSAARRRAGGDQRDVYCTDRTHALISLPSSWLVWSSFPNTRPGDRATLPKTCGTLRPTGRPASTVWLLIAFHARDRNAGAEGGRPSRAHANVSRPPPTP